MEIYYYVRHGLGRKIEKIAGHKQWLRPQRSPGQDGLHHRVEQFWALGRHASHGLAPSSAITSLFTIGFFFLGQILVRHHVHVFHFTQVGSAASALHH
jgi:hypothetical protein